MPKKRSPKWPTIAEIAHELTLINREAMAYREPPTALCPICGRHVSLTGKTTDGRLIGSCRDAFTQEQWDEDYEEDEVEEMPVRLQVTVGGWENALNRAPATNWRLHSGDASYDTDHHGYWGSSSVPGKEPFDARGVARDLIEECKESYAQGED